MLYEAAEAGDREFVVFFSSRKGALLFPEAARRLPGDSPEAPRRLPPEGPRGSPDGPRPLKSENRLATAPREY